jgi:hypothetical protein
MTPHRQQPVHLVIAEATSQEHAVQAVFLYREDAPFTLLHANA